MKNIQKVIEKTILADEKNAKKLFRREGHLKHYYKNIALNPLVLSKEQYLDIKSATESIGALLEKTIKLYFLEKKVQDFFQFSTKQKKIIKNYRPDMRSIYLSRFDGFIDSKNNFRFIEFNVNHPGGTERLDHLTQIIQKFYSPKAKLANKNNIFDSYLSTVKKLYKKAGSKYDMAIGFGSTFDMHDMKALKKIALNIKTSLNINVNISDFSKFVYKNNNLYYKNKKISLLYRAEYLQRFWQYDYSIVKIALKALEDKKIVMYNLPQAYIGGTKNLFALWYEKWFWKYLDKDEIEAIKLYIPKTYGLDSSNIIEKEITGNKNKWVIKPIAGFGGSRVYIGKELNDNRWQKIVGTHIGSKHFILQEFVKSDTYGVYSLDTQKELMNKMDCYLNVSPWYIDGKMQGISVRYAPKLIINVKKGGGIMSVLIKK